MLCKLWVWKFLSLNYKRLLESIIVSRDDTSVDWSGTSLLLKTVKCCIEWESNYRYARNKNSAPFSNWIKLKNSIINCMNNLFKRWIFNATSLLLFNEQNIINMRIQNSRYYFHNQLYKVKEITTFKQNDW